MSAGASEWSLLAAFAFLVIAIGFGLAINANAGERRNSEKGCKGESGVVDEQSDSHGCSGYNCCPVDREAFCNCSSDHHEEYVDPHDPADRVLCSPHFACNSLASNKNCDVEDGDYLRE